MSDLDKAIDETTEALADGLDASDIATLIRNGIEIAERLDEVSGEEKGAAALAYASDLIDKFWDPATPAMVAAIKAIDIPYVPEGIEEALIDPLLAKATPPILKHFVKLALPSMVELVVEASKGGVQVNASLWLKAASVIDLLQQHGPAMLVALNAFGGGHGTSDIEAAKAALAELARTF